MSVIVSLESLRTSAELINAQENQHKSAVSAIANLSAEFLQPILLKWALAGFPDDYILHQIVIGPPIRCSDGIIRKFIDYMYYLFPNMSQVEAYLFLLEQKLPGMKLSHSFNESTLNVHVRKAR
jgi:hypothetical protein